jgi:hypothetical protein
LDPYSAALWIRIRIGNPDPDPGARKLRNFSGKMHLLVILYKTITKKFFEQNFDEEHRYFLFDLIQILISKKFENKIVFESSALAWIRNRIRIEQKCWILISNKSIRIHNPA